MGELWAALVEAGIAPPNSETPAATSDRFEGDLLPIIRQLWSSHSRGNQHSKRERQLVGRLGALAEQGGRLTCGFPGPERFRVAAWLGTRLFWWPRGVPRGRRVGVVSSRLGQELETHRTWFTVLRAACMKLDARREVLVTAGSTAAQRFVRRSGELFGVPILQFDFPVNDSEDVASWWNGIDALPSETADSCQTVRVSPPLGLGERMAETSLAQLPAADRAVVALCDRLLCLRVRGRGNIDELVRARLADTAFPAATVYLALGDDLVPREVASELLSLGAVGWVVLNTLGEPQADADTPWPSTAPERLPTAAVISVDSMEPEGWLTHCTRRRRGPWPKEDEKAYLDDLILDRAGGDHSALASLWRIIRGRRLIASADLVRGNVPVVSFTAVPLSELAALRTYRSHLGRWDFEPYGISIRRSWLETKGARPVAYGDESLWAELPDEERPFFQVRQSNAPSGRILNWTAEREWRHVGDVLLDEIPPDEATLFVPSEREARQLATTSRWPVTVVPSRLTRP